MRRFCTFSLIACFSVLLLTGLSATLLAGKGGGKGGGGGGKDGGGGDPPPVLYEITWLNTLGFPEGSVSDMNENGDVVGQLRDENGHGYAFLNTDVVGTLNLDSLMNVDPGWTATWATSVNNHGEITGQVIDDITGTVGVFLYRPSPTPSFEIIAVDTGNIPHINNDGDVVFNYRDGDGTRHLALYHGDTELTEDLNIVGANYGINDSGQILGVYQDANLQFSEYFLYTPLVGEIPLPVEGRLGMGGFNNAASFVGERAAGKRSYEAFRYDFGPGLTSIATAKTFAEGRGINELGDVCGRLGSSGFYFSDRHGLLNLDDLVTGTTDELADWFSAGIYAIDISTPTDPDSPTGFGLISGGGRIDGAWRPFVLTPIAPSSP